MKSKISCFICFTMARKSNCIGRFRTHLLYNAEVCRNFLHFIRFLGYFSIKYLKLLSEAIFNESDNRAFISTLASRLNKRIQLKNKLSRMHCFYIFLTVKE